MTSTTTTQLDQSLVYPSPLKEFWSAFSHNKGAVAGLGFMILMAVSYTHLRAHET